MASVLLFNLKGWCLKFYESKWIANSLLRAGAVVAISIPRSPFQNFTVYYILINKYILCLLLISFGNHNIYNINNNIVLLNFIW